MNQMTIIGGGAAGVGIGIMLEQLGCSQFQILEQEEIGASFRRWPKETRFITPSFTSNGFGMPDLNAVSMETSPAYTLGAEHLSGSQFADYLKLLADTYRSLNIRALVQFHRLLKVINSKRITAS